jgi:hypothetical protein
VLGSYWEDSFWNGIVRREEEQGKYVGREKIEEDQEYKERR